MKRNSPFFRVFLLRSSSVSIFFGGIHRTQEDHGLGYPAHGADGRAERERSALSDIEVQKSKVLRVYKSKHPEIPEVEAQKQQTSGKLNAETLRMIGAVKTEAVLGGKR